MKKYYIILEKNTLKVFAVTDYYTRDFYDQNHNYMLLEETDRFNKEKEKIFRRNQYLFLKFLSPKIFDNYSYLDEKFDEQIREVIYFYSHRKFSLKQHFLKVIDHCLEKDIYNYVRYYY